MMRKEPSDELLDALGKIADSIDNIMAATELPLPPAMHLEQIKYRLPEWSAQIKGIYVELCGENPWEE